MKCVKTLKAKLKLRAQPLRTAEVPPSSYRDRVVTVLYGRVKRKQRGPWCSVSSEPDATVTLAGEVPNSGSLHEYGPLALVSLHLKCLMSLICWR